MSTSRPTTPLHTLASTALAVAAVVFVWTAQAAIRLTPTATLERARVASDLPTDSLRTPLSDADIEGAVSHDLFSPLRSAPARRYTLGESEPTETVRNDEQQAVVSPELPTVQGTAVNATGDGFAMCAAPGGPVVVVRPGDTVGAFTVVSIERTRVVFRDAIGRRHTVEAVGSPSGDES